MTTSADLTETTTIGHSLRPVPAPAAQQPPPRTPTHAPATSPDDDPVAALHRWAHTLGQVFLCDTHGRTRPLWTTWRRRRPYVEPSWEQP